jgi:hypothetical protein
MTIAAWFTVCCHTKCWPMPHFQPRGVEREGRQLSGATHVADHSAHTRATDMLDLRISTTMTSSRVVGPTSCALLEIDAEVKSSEG